MRVPAVAGGDDRNAAEIREVVDREVLRVRQAVETEGTSQRQVHHVQPVREVVVAIRIARPLQRVEDIRRRSRAAENLQGIEQRPRRHAGTDAELREANSLRVASGVGRAVCQHPEARDDAGHVGTMSVARAVERVIVRSCATAAVIGIAYEVMAADDFGRGKTARFDRGGIVRRVGGGCAGATEVRVGVVDSGIDDADADATSVEVGRHAAPGRRGADPWNARGGLRPMALHRLHPRDTGNRREPFNHGSRNTEADRVDQPMETPFLLGPQRTGLGGDGILFRPDRRDPRHHLRRGTIGDPNPRRRFVGQHREDQHFVRSRCGNGPNRDSHAAQERRQNEASDSQTHGALWHRMRIRLSP